MGIELTRRSLVFWRPIYSETRTQTESTESVVPDTMPDVERILTTEASVCLRGKQTDGGFVSAEGEIRGTILYLGEDDEIQKIDLRMPVAFRMENERIERESAAIVRLAVDAAEAKALNPRKLFLQVTVSAFVTVYGSTGLSLPVEAEDGDLMIRREERTLRFRSLVTEKSFSVSEEIALPAARPTLEKLLCYRLTAVPGEMRPVGDKRILQGSLQLEMLYLGENRGEPIQERLSAPFSQLLDVPEACGEAEEILLQPGAVYAEPVPGAYGAGSVHLEAQIHAQIRFQSGETLSVLTDAYSVRYEAETETEELPVLVQESPVLLRDTLRIPVEDTAAGAEPVCGSASCGTPEWTESGIRVPIRVYGMVRREEGRLCGFSRFVTASFPVEREGDCLYQPGIPGCGEPFLSAGGNGLEIRLTAEIPLYKERSENWTALKSVEIAEERPSDPAAVSLTIVRWENEDLWPVAKRLGSTEELIRAANPAAVPGDILLIPRAR